MMRPCFCLLFVVTSGQELFPASSADEAGEASPPLLPTTKLPQRAEAILSFPISTRPFPARTASAASGVSAQPLLPLASSSSTWQQGELLFPTAFSLPPGQDFPLAANLSSGQLSGSFRYWRPLGGSSGGSATPLLSLSFDGRNYSCLAPEGSDGAWLSVRWILTPSFLTCHYVAGQRLPPSTILYRARLPPYATLKVDSRASDSEGYCVDAVQLEGETRSCAHEGVEGRLACGCESARSGRSGGQNFPANPQQTSSLSSTPKTTTVSTITTTMTRAASSRTSSTSTTSSAFTTFSTATTSTIAAIPTDSSTTSTTTEKPSTSTVTSTVFSSSNPSTTISSTATMSSSPPSSSSTPLVISTSSSTIATSTSTPILSTSSTLTTSTTTTTTATKSTDTSAPSTSTTTSTTREPSTTEQNTTTTSTTMATTTSPGCVKSEGVWYKCLNGGFCQRKSDTVSGFCGCHHATGKNCAFANMCEKYHPCLNGGSCFNDEDTRLSHMSQNASYSCQCPPNFSGVNCESIFYNTTGRPTSKGTPTPRPIMTTTDPNICIQVNDQNYECLNGGDCLKGRSHSTCTCQENYTGRNCAFADSCALYEPCLNEGECFQEDKTGVVESVPQNNSFYCKCSGYWEGPTCAKLQSHLSPGEIGGIVVAVIGTAALAVLAYYAGRYLRRSRRLRGKYNPAKEESTAAIPMSPLALPHSHSKPQR